MLSWFLKTPLFLGAVRFDNPFSRVKDFFHRRKIEKKRGITNMIVHEMGHVIAVLSCPEFFKLKSAEVEDHHGTTTYEVIINSNEQKDGYISQTYATRFWIEQAILYAAGLAAENVFSAVNYDNSFSDVRMFINICKHLDSSGDKLWRVYGAEEYNGIPNTYKLLLLSDPTLSKSQLDKFAPFLRSCIIIATQRILQHPIAIGRIQTELEIHRKLEEKDFKRILKNLFECYEDEIEIVEGDFI